MTDGTTGADAERAVRDAFRAEHGSVVATVARLTGDLGLAEDATQEAFAIALRRWPVDGVPVRPGAWLTTTARNRARDVLRREGTRADREEAATRDRVAALESDIEEAHPVGDDRLRLLFTCCHPALARSAHVELTLRLVCGLTVPEIARALLRSEAAVGKSIQRAKAKIRTAGVPFRAPDPDRLPERLPSVLDCAYLTYSEGYAATAGEALVRHELCEEGVRLARLIVDLLPDRPGPEALLALVLLQDARRPARLDPEGEPVLLAEQNRTLWDRDRIAEGMGWLDRASAHPEVTAAEAALLFQAAIAGEHSSSPTWVATDWTAIVTLYDRLTEVTTSPVVALNRAVAVSFADGPGAAAPLLEALRGDPRLVGSHRLALARADIARRMGHTATAAEAYREAVALGGTGPERRLAERRVRELDGS